MAKYKIEPLNQPATAAFELDAASVEVDNASGAVTFKDTDGNVVAQQRNVNFRLLPDAA